MKDTTVCFYTDEGMYKGWEYKRNVKVVTARSWLLSGNYLVTKDKIFNSFASYTSLACVFKG